MASSNSKREDDLQVEVLRAVCRTKRPPAELAWLFSQCSKSDLYRLYKGGSAVPPLYKQTFRQWKSLVDFQRVTHPRRRRHRMIVIQPLTHSSSPSGYTMTKIDATVLKHLQNFCQSFFLNMRVEITDPLDLSQIKNLSSRIHEATSREQFLVGDILKYLKAHRPRDAYSVIGITTADLYPSEQENFVLGHASLTSGCGVFSFGRYFNSQLAARTGDSDSSPDPNCQLQNLWVLIRVMTHELCHTFGMKHCYYFECAMNESSSIEEAARQPLFLCPICLRKLQRALRFSVLERLRALVLQCQEFHQVVKDCSEAVRGEHRCTEEEERFTGRQQTPVASKEVDHTESTVSVTVDGTVEHLEYFRQAIEWLKDSIASLLQFTEQ